MKTNRLIILLAFLPQLVSAQWSQVRFDQYNFFNKVVAATPANAIVTGADQSGIGSFILRTNNGGASWDSIVLNSPLDTYTVGELYFTDINNGFAGGIKNNFQSLLKTFDNGSTWTEITPDPTLLLPINVISFVDPLNGYVSDETNLYKTNDGGANWVSTLPGFVLKDLVFSDMTNGYACGESTPDAVVMKTNDGGQTWNTVLSASLQLFSNSMQKLDVINSDVVYCSGMYTNTLYRTVDGGATWDTITMSQIWGIQDFDFINQNVGHVLSTMGEIFGTSDGGQTWTLEYSVASGAYGPSVFLVSISFAGTTGYVCGSNGLIKKYTEGTTGIATPEASDAITFYPNPVSGNGILNLNGPGGTENMILEIYNQTGQLVVYRDQMKTEETLELNLPGGIYNILITQNESRISKKLVVVK